MRENLYVYKKFITFANVILNTIFLPQGRLMPIEEKWHLL